MSESAVAFLRGQKSKTRLKDFLNNFAAEPWKEYEIIANKNEEEILKCRSDLAPQTVPESAVALTAGIDVQKTGFWYVVRAWAKDWTSWNIDHGFLGNWADVEKLLFENVYPVPDSDRVLKIWRAAIDTGGGKYNEVSSTEETYLWLQQYILGNRGCRVWGVKGSSNPLPTKLRMGDLSAFRIGGRNGVRVKKSILDGFIEKREQVEGL